MKIEPIIAALNKRIDRVFVADAKPFFFFFFFFFFFLMFLSRNHIGREEVFSSLLTYVGCNIY